MTTKRKLGPDLVLTLADLVLTLERLRACSDAVDWARTQTGLYSAWRSCPRGDWLLWIAARLGVDRRVVVFAACQCAREALQFVPAGEDRTRIAIETAEAWTRGEATIDEVRTASAAARAYASSASAASASYAASYAAYASYASASASSYAAAADAAAASAASASAYASYASAYASYASASYAASYAADAADADAAAAADAASARRQMRLTTAGIVRKHIPWRLVRAALEAQR